jgi:hypothetical protein
MGTFRFQLWRIGYARDDYAEIGGWVRVCGKLWWYEGR